MISIHAICTQYVGLKISRGITLTLTLNSSAAVLSFSEEKMRRMILIEEIRQLFEVDISLLFLWEKIMN